MADIEILARHIEAGDKVIEIHGVGPDGTCHCGKGKNCGSAGKHPRARGWQDSTGLTLAEVEAVVVARPRANFGLLTGFRFWVLDIDIDHGGLASLKALIAKWGPLPATHAVRTGSGGWHLYFAAADFEVPNSAGKVGPGIDVRGKGGQVVAPGSRSAKGEYSVCAGVVPW